MLTPTPLLAWSEVGLVTVGHTPSDSGFWVLAAARNPASPGPQAAAGEWMMLEGASSGLLSAMALGFGACSIPEGVL